MRTWGGEIVHSSSRGARGSGAIIQRARGRDKEREQEREGEIEIWKGSKDRNRK